MAFDVRSLIALRRVTALDASPDGRWLAVEVRVLDDTTARYRSQLWRVPCDGALPTMLLPEVMSASAPCFRYDGSLAFLSDHDPDDLGSRPDHGAHKQVWLWRDGALERVTDEALGVSAFRCAATRERMVLVAPHVEGVDRDTQRERAATRKEKGPSVLRYTDFPVRFWDHWLPDAVPHFVCVDAAGRRDLTPTAGASYRNASWDLSADGSTLVSTRHRIGVDRLPVQALEVFDLDTGTVRRFRDDDDRTHAGVCVDAAGRHVAVTTSRWERGRTRPDTLWVGTIDEDGLRGEAWDDGVEQSLQPAAWRGDALVCTAQVDGDHAVFEVRPGQAKRITERGTWTGLCRRAPEWGIHHGTLHPPEVAHVTEGRLSALAGDTPGAEVSHHHTPVSDGAEVAWWLVRPKGVQGPLPTLLWIHGGPISAWGDQWHWRWNALVMAEAGWQVVLPNPRGSTGYGQAFVDGIWGNAWGGRCFDDLMELTDELAVDPRVDPTRMVAMGGSFGGYMTNWIGTQTDRFAALVTHASVFAYGTFYGTTDLPAYWRHMLGNHPWGDRDAFERYSPDRYVANWTTPVLVLHGEKDYRVPISEALYLFEALRAHDVDAELMVFPDENHWILKPHNIEAWYDGVIDFLDRKVVG